MAPTVAPLSCPSYCARLLDAPTGVCGHTLSALVLVSYHVRQGRTERKSTRCVVCMPVPPTRTVLTRVEISLCLCGFIFMLTVVVGPHHHRLCFSAIFNLTPSNPLVFETCTRWWESARATNP